MWIQNELRPNGLIFHHLEPERQGRLIQEWLMRLYSPHWRNRTAKEGGYLVKMQARRMDLLDSKNLWWSENGYGVREWWPECWKKDIKTEGCKGLEQVVGCNFCGVLASRGRSQLPRLGWWGTAAAHCKERGYFRHWWQSTRVGPFAAVACGVWVGILLTCVCYLWIVHSFPENCGVFCSGFVVNFYSFVIVFVFYFNYGDFFEF